MKNDLIDYLMNLGADEVPHSGRTLLDHLTGTASIVERWGEREDVVHAALFHSIYGTEFFRRATLGPDDRPTVAQKIGAYAERLVWLFCMLDRASLTPAAEEIVLRDGKVREPVTSEERRDLLCILWANAFDHPGARLSIANLEAAATCLPARAVAELRAFIDITTARDRAELVKQPIDPAVSCVAALLCGASTEDLLATDPAGVPAWLRQPFVAHGPVERLAGLVDFSREELFDMPRTFAKAFFNGTSVAVQPGEEEAHYQRGHTVYLHSVRSPTIDAWMAAVSDELGLLHEATRVSAFASKKGPGLKPHYDPNDNIVCQAKGTKRWRYSTLDAVRYATTGQTVGSPIGRVPHLESGGRIPSELRDPVTVDMVPGSVMVMPRGIWHATETVDEESIHLNIQTGTVTWKDVLDFLLPRSPALHAEFFRAPVTHGLTGEAFRKALADHIHVLADAATARCDTPAFHDFVARRRSAY